MTVPDLLTHMASALVVGAVLDRRRYTPGLGVGACLPDLLGRVPGYAAPYLQKVGLDLGEVLVDGSGFLHLPLGLLPATVLVAWLANRGERFSVWWPLVVGSGLHLFLDSLQIHWGVGTMWLFPISTWEWEAGVMGSESTVWYAPWFFGSSGLLWRLRHGNWPWRLRGVEATE